MSDNLSFRAHASGECVRRQSDFQGPSRWRSMRPSHHSGQRCDRDRFMHNRRRRVHLMVAWRLLRRKLPATTHGQHARIAIDFRTCCSTSDRAGFRPVDSELHLFQHERQDGLELYVAYISPTHEAYFDSSRCFSSTDRRVDEVTTIEIRLAGRPGRTQHKPCPVACRGS